MDNLTFLAVLVFISFTISIVFLINGMVEEFVYYNNANKSFGISIILFVIFVIRLMIYSTKVDNGEYYLEAEKYTQKDNEIIFTTEQGFYKWESSSNEEYPETIYLLTMYDNKTKDTKDDIISVVWESKS